MISVIIPTYNRANSINKAIASVFAQTIKVLEVIIIDDGSTDGTQAVVENEWGGRVRYLYQANEGACSARNKGMELARGEFIAFLDSDDRWAPEKLAKQVQAFRAKSSERTGVAVCDGEYIDENGSVSLFNSVELKCNAFEQLIHLGKYVGVSTSTFMIHRKVVESGLRFDVEMPARQDWDFLTSVAREFDIVTVNERLVSLYRVPGEMRVRTARRVVRARQLAITKYRQDLLARPTAHARHYLALARTFFGMRRMDCVRAMLKMARVVYPESVSLLWIWLSYANWRIFGVANRAARKTRDLSREIRIVPNLNGPFE